MTQQPLFWGSTPQNWKHLFAKIYMHPYVHCSTIRDGQDMETTKVPFDRGLDKEYVVHIYCGTLFGHQKRWNTAIGDMNGPWEY